LERAPILKSSYFRIFSKPQHVAELKLTIRDAKPIEKAAYLQSQLHGACSWVWGNLNLKIVFHFFFCIKLCSHEIGMC
jgi:hypothetical protein